MAPAKLSAEFNQDFSERLSALEADLQDLRQRHQQVQQAELEQTEIESQRQQLQAQLEALGDRLTELEFTLESRLFNWRTQGQAFWQFLRFAGLGFALALAINALKGSG